ncbi:MAG: hypothetical protein Q4D85_06425 [Corynebacterium sp.]|uniref:hypothetical protein n=1 Tax=Corynebacterium sp. TaxID=1720 RepID=UPI0026DCEF12|nr:hypothetical protein [Corynebacterium sp.]MDO5098380.1 hypothetical protein [Corynebacterium sp.]
MENEESEPIEILKLPDEDVSRLHLMATHGIFDPDDFEELLGAFDEIAVAQESKGKSYLTLDFLSQMLYTSGHAADKHGFEDGFDWSEEGEDDLDALDLHRYHAVQKAFADPALKVEWDGLQDALHATDENVTTLGEIYDNLDSLVDPEHFVLCISSDDPRDFLACLPNGYFADDLNPFEVAAIIERMTTSYGLTLLGMGASTLAFRRPPGTELDVAGIVSDMQHVYGNTTGADWHKVAAGIAATGLVLFSYSGFWE